MLNRLSPLFHSSWRLHLIIAGAILYCLSIPESPPKIVAVAEELSPGDPLVLTFSQPIENNNLDGKVTVIKNDVMMPGSLQRRSDSTLIFSPATPWESGQTYKVRLGSIAAKQGGVLMDPIEYQFHIRHPRLFFITPDQRLAVKRLSDGDIEIITPEGVAINSYSVGRHDRFAAVYSLKEGGLNGIVLGRRLDNSYALTFSKPVERPKYSAALLCNQDTSLLSVFQEKTYDQKVDYSLISWEEPTVTLSPRDWTADHALIYGKEDLYCSESTTRILHRTKSGTYATNFLGEKTEDLVGVFDTALGFAPRDALMILKKTVSEKDADYRLDIFVYQSRGASMVISEVNSLVQEASFDGNGSAFSLLKRNGTNDLSRIDLYTSLDESSWEKKLSLPEPTGQQIHRHALSRDGQLFALELLPKQSGIDYTSPPAAEIQIWTISTDAQSISQWPGRDPQWAK